MNSQLKYLQHFLHYYFSFKFLTNSIYFVTPTINPPSKIFNQKHNFDLQNLSLLFLSNLLAAVNDKITLVYSTSTSGFNFKNLLRSLNDYKGPTFIIIKHSNKVNIINFINFV